VVEAVPEQVPEVDLLEVPEVEDLILQVDVVEQEILPHNHVIKEILEELVLEQNLVMLVVEVVEQQRLVLQELHLALLM
tara:strand:- start:630 stop:866 length:237 start_codon:yes stop_codon:yes gene_type:complete